MAFCTKFHDAPLVIERRIIPKKLLPSMPVGPFLFRLLNCELHRSSERISFIPRPPMMAELVFLACQIITSRSVFARSLFGRLNRIWLRLPVDTASSLATGPGDELTTVAAYIRLRSPTDAGAR